MRTIDERLRWLGGPVAAPKLKALVAKQRTEILAEASRHLVPPPPVYTPWLCHYGALGRLPSILSSPCADKLVTQRDRLTAITSFVSGEDGYFDLNLDAGLKIRIDFKDFESRVKHFVVRYGEATRILFEGLPWIEDLDGILIDEIVPITTDRTDIDRVGLSSHFTKGVIYLMFNPELTATRIFQSAIDLAHEVGHHVLMVYLGCDKVLESPHEQPVYSGARGTAREAIRSFHGAVALSYEKMANLALMTSPSEKSEAAWLRTNLATIQERLTLTVNELKKECQFTKLGAVLLDEIDVVNKL